MRRIAAMPVFRPVAFLSTPAVPALRRLPLRVAQPPTHGSPFSTSAALQAPKVQARKTDTRITQIRYHLQHPKTPRPLRFSRLRALRHWTIHRAWLTFRRQQRRDQELELERQYNAMRDACEALRLMDEKGMVGQEGGKDVGRLYRTAMTKDGVWDGVPIEYARPQVETPSRQGWNHAWKR